ncbi:ribonuclease P protein subunit p38-like isoform X2 [Dendrobates tinctorius]|uniref:ribonuclease P protein subunit p38-like isoform X2 n=1 Tax=Dendrobates tinctorius TaxID=92724 RepID=UPI003CCA468D
MGTESGGAKNSNNMAAKTPKGPIRKSKPIVSKTSLNSPYEKIWTPVVGEDMQFILQTLLKKFEELGLKKLENHTRSSNGKKGQKGKLSDGNKEKVADKEIPEAEEAQKTGWTYADLRKQLAIGINEVTRALEKNDLDMVIVCKSAKPEMITRHIIELSYSREAPACQLPRLSENVAPALGLKSVLALGFRKSSDVFQEQVLAIKARVPPLHVPWLPTGFGQNEDVCVSEANSEEEKSVIPTPSRKRKFSPSERPPDVKLQELKVKKIVPNPKKKRKVKVKKSLVKKITKTLPGSIKKEKK